MKPSKRVPSVSHVGVVFHHVHDVERMRDFYCSAMGLRVLWKDNNGATGLVTRTRKGPLFIIDNKQISPDSEIEFNLETDDIESIHRHMRSNGVDTGEIRHFDDSALFHFMDEDGYGLMIWGAKSKKE